MDADLWMKVFTLKLMGLLTYGLIGLIMLVDTEV